MTGKEKYLQIKQLMEKECDVIRAVPMAAYMRNQFHFYGISTPRRRKIYREFLNEERKGGKIDWEFLDLCWEDKFREMQYLAMDYLDRMKRRLTYENIPSLEVYVRTRPWWDTIDGLDRLIGDIGLSDPRVAPLMLNWSMDEDFWVRRVAIDHQLSRKELTDTALLEQIIVNNFGSHEFFINKAIGWSLREYSKTDPEWVRAFVERHRQRMSPLSIREASRRLPELP